MESTYLQLNPIPGKWYVSERLPATSKRWQVIDPSETEPKRSATDMILAGPFDSHKLAMDWNTLAKAGGYIWEREVLSEETSEGN